MLYEVITVFLYDSFYKYNQLLGFDARLEAARYRLLGTGFFSSVRLSLRKGSERGQAVLVNAIKILRVTSSSFIFIDELTVSGPGCIDEDQITGIEQTVIVVHDFIWGLGSGSIF